MPHHTPLIATIVAGLVLAFIFGTLAHRLKMPPLVGYLVAGIAIGPFTPGFVGDADLAQELAEIGVILLMFGVGLHFSLKDLLSVKNIAIPGAVAQITIATLLGMALGWLLGWPVGEGFLFGLALSVASTVVLLKALQERRLVETQRGRIAVGWLIVEDIAMVLALVLIPALSGILGGKGEALSGNAVLLTLGITLGKVVAFAAVMLIVGRRVIPWILERIADTGSRELFRLAVLAIALGFALGSAYVFGVSFALGAFFAGMILSESELSHRAAEESLPLRDAFSVLFFVSVGMLFDPSIVAREPLLVLATVLIIVVGKSLGALLIVRAFGYPNGTALTISASLAQIGEFSFILATLGLSLDLLSPMARDLILGGAILSILLNPLLFSLLDRYEARQPKAPQGGDEPQKVELQDHVVLVGFGRVGRGIGEQLRAQGKPFVVIEAQLENLEALRAAGVPALYGNAAQSELLQAAAIDRARWLLVAIPEVFEAGQVIENALELNPGLQVVARAHSDAEIEHLEKHGAQRVIMGEREIARGMLELVGQGA
ncbi:Kef family K(+) transporter [Herbaspirillum seropedicae]|uniref:Kef-type potassium efflux transporter (NAD-binding component) protein n=1 Tax=Herbaspirillum seropedicae (strain SmR1) TaxID=757424 RepID=D8ISC6_HERSS|nr:YbaL family putative K(+) efflux transporter [Herbaspirillum seropedicae]ADJ63470.1 Kef-type potassium efflux transporter (NAD-binding component) protein [Herbaspirillum seropedicae SmR1]AKN65503.1 sodium:proton antiporter [Herbaspirillum seropedicae]AON54291.1 Kef-type potassium efflux transporter NAD-binding protein [Herbaspirillum seropedicae]MDR6394717.1 CPA2 family monovalent cation:H+ antiporter-2 [Herbaspirillum seropedicae]NQE28661.1 sodium:proton antiporter [Herbaspirillum seropedi